MHDAKWQGRWNQLKGKVQEQWGDLTNDDLDKIEGRRDQLIGRIQERYGEKQEKVQRDVEAWEKKHGLS